jgi:hypothetical protein
MAPKRAAVAAIVPFHIPIGPGTPTKNGKRIACHLCPSQSSSWTSLVSHYEKTHAVQNACMVGQYAAAQAVAQRIADGNIVMSDIEAASVCPADDPRFVKCVDCDVCVSKTSLLLHFSRKHAVDLSAVKLWIAVVDGNRIRNGYPANCCFEECHDAATQLQLAAAAQHDAGIAFGDDEAEHAPDAESPAADVHDSEEEDTLVDDDGGVCGAPAEGHVAGDRLEALAESVGALTKAVEHASKPQQLEVTPPSLSVSVVARAWEHGTNNKLRHQFPLKCTRVAAIRYDDFERYMDKNLNQEASTRSSYQLAITRLLNIVNVDLGGDDKVDFKAFLVAMHRDNVLYTIMDYPIMDLRYGWARHMVFALDHFCKFGSYEANRLELPKTKWCIEQLLAETIKPWKNRAHDAKKRQSMDKQAVDGSRLDDLPPIAECKAAVRQAMCDLATISEKAAATSTITVREKFLANAALAGIIVYGTFAGRSGEWHLMDRVKVQSKMENGDDKLICGKHKTAKYYGSIAKWVPPGLRQAIVVYCNLPCKTSSKLFEPARESGDAARHFHLGPALKAFGKHYTPSREYPRINLLRKMFHSILVNGSREESLMGLIGKADGHSAGMGMKTYALMGAKQDTAVGELVYKKVFGEPVPWPSRKEIDDTKATLDTALKVMGALMDQAEDENFSDDEEVDAIERTENAQPGGIAHMPIADAGAASTECARGPLREQGGMGRGGGADPMPIGNLTDAQFEQRVKDKKEDHRADAKIHAATRGHLAHEPPPEMAHTGLRGAHVAASSASGRPAPLGKQPRVEGDRGGEAHVVKRGRKSAFTDEQKDWINAQHRSLHGTTGVAASVLLKEIVEGGIRDGALPQEATAEKIREVVRAQLR